ncbi:MAG: hypothetical protein HY746_02380 [Elusimicrobia bacterium]|nr:hypothetical protein [Elusimicrobiota bacterium]
MKTKVMLNLTIFFWIFIFIAAIPADSKTDKTMPEPPSGTKPAEPAVPGEKPAEPAVPGEKTETDKPDTSQDDKLRNGSDKSDPYKDDKKPEDKEKSDKKQKKDKKDKAKKDKSKKGSKLNPSLSASPASQGAGAGAAGGVLGRILGIFGGSGDKEKQTKSSATITGASVSTATLAGRPAAATTLFSQGNGPKIAVFDFEGQSGPEFADYLSEALGAKGFKVYNRNVFKEKGLSGIQINRVVIKKISNEAGCDYLVTGKISKKTETLFIISVFLKDGKNADIKMTHFVKIKDISEIKKGAEQAAEKIKTVAN